MCAAEFETEKERKGLIGKYHVMRRFIDLIEKRFSL